MAKCRGLRFVVVCVFRVCARRWSFFFGLVGYSKSTKAESGMHGTWHLAHENPVKNEEHKHRAQNTNQSQSGMLHAAMSDQLGAS
jgi:hypothetical protein